MFELGNEKFLKENPEKVAKFMRAVKRATDYVLAEPEKAWADYVDFKPAMASALNRKIFERSYAYFSKDLKNVERDWVSQNVPLLVSELTYTLPQTKVTKYGKRLGVLDEDFVPNYTNSFLSWNLEAESATPVVDQKNMVVLQKDVAEKGGFKRLPIAIQA